MDTLDLLHALYHDTGIPETVLLKYFGYTMATMPESLTQQEVVKGIKKLHEVRSPEFIIDVWLHTALHEPDGIADLVKNAGKHTKIPPITDKKLGTHLMGIESRSK